MNLKTYAEENELTMDEAKELTGLTHWNQTVPESCGEIPEVEEEEVISVEEIIEAIAEQPDTPDLSEEAEFSIFILGNKSPHWNK